MTESQTDCMIPQLHMNLVFKWHPCIYMTVPHRQALVLYCLHNVTKNVIKYDGEFKSHIA